MKAVPLLSSDKTVNLWLIISAFANEGIVSKRLGSPYRSGRSPHWLKIKNPVQQ